MAQKLVNRVIVRIFDQLARQVGLRGGESLIEIGNRLSLPFVQVGFDLMHENGTRPAVFDTGMSVLFTQSRIFELRGKHDIVPPGQSSNNLLDDCLVRVGRSKGTHIEKICA